MYKRLLLSEKRDRVEHVDILISGGKPYKAACLEAQISESNYRRWKSKLAGATNDSPHLALNQKNFDALRRKLQRAEQKAAHLESLLAQLITGKLTIEQIVQTYLKFD